MSIRRRHAQRRKSQSGFTLMEVVLAMVIFLMMSVMFAAVFPIAVRAGKLSNNYAQAAQLAQHKIDQVRAAGINKLGYSDLNAAQIIDPMATPPSGLPATYTFTAVDGLAPSGGNGGYFPPGSTGTLTISDYNAYLTSQGKVSPVPTGVMDYITINIQWSGGGVSSGSYTTSALIIKMKHS